jgi:probable HAF family extracellular repeat protein
MQVLGTLPGGGGTQAIGINNAGQVVGISISSGGGSSSFLWSEEAGMQDLNDLIPADSGWELGDVQDINDNGQIVGEGRYNGQRRGYVLVPS